MVMQYVLGPLVVSWKQRGMVFRFTTYKKCEERGDHLFPRLPLGRLAPWPGGPDIGPREAFLAPVHGRVGVVHDYNWPSLRRPVST